MRIVSIETIVSCGEFPASRQWGNIRQDALIAIRAAEWPPNSGSFTIYPESGKKRGEGNGVKPIKDRTIAQLTQGRRGKAGAQLNSWVAEYPWPVGERKRPGNMDAAYIAEGCLVCLEWETGNISSSHRSVNKICLGLHTGVLKAGLLVVPSMELAPFLTDRIGNIGELMPYFPLWRALPCSDGVFEIVVIEQDATSRDVPRIRKGTDGRAAS